MISLLWHARLCALTGNVQPRVRREMIAQNFDRYELWAEHPARPEQVLVWEHREGERVERRLRAEALVQPSDAAANHRVLETFKGIQISLHPIPCSTYKHILSGWPLTTINILGHRVSHLTQRARNWRRGHSCNRR